MFIKQRVPQQVGTRGSLKWIQRLIELNPTLLTDAVRAGVGETSEWTVEWVSPRRRDEWAEYRDAGFLLQLDLPELVPTLKTFWPPGGPQWDALGKASGEKWFWLRRRLTSMSLLLTAVSGRIVWVPSTHIWDTKATFDLAG